MADVVLDASALVDLLLGNAKGEAVKSRLSGHRLHAPAHLDAEVVSALGRLPRRALLRRQFETVASGLTWANVPEAVAVATLALVSRAGQLSEDKVELILSEIRQAVIRRHPMRRLLPGAWSRRHRLRLADALYVELAAELGVLVTTDRRLRDLPMVDVVEVAS